MPGGIRLPLIHRLNDLATDGLRPDLTILLDLDPAVGLARVTQRQQSAASTLDRLESEALAFHQRVRDGYHALALAEPERVACFDATLPASLLEAQIRECVRPLFPRPPARRVPAEDTPALDLAAAATAEILR